MPRQTKKGGRGVKLPHQESTAQAAHAESDGAEQVSEAPDATGGDSDKAGNVLGRKCSKSSQAERRRRLLLGAVQNRLTAKVSGGPD